MEVCAWRCVKGGSLDLRAQLLDLLLPGALLAQQRRLHQRAHLLAHLAVHLAQRRERRGVRDVRFCEVPDGVWGVTETHLAQLAVLLHQLLRAAAQLVDVTFELRRIGPRDLLPAARRVRRLLRLRRRRELLEAEGVVEE